MSEISHSSFSSRHSWFLNVGGAKYENLKHFVLSRFVVAALEIRDVRSDLKFLSQYFYFVFTVMIFYHGITKIKGIFHSTGLAM